MQPPGPISSAAAPAHVSRSAARFGLTAWAPVFVLVLAFAAFFPTYFHLFPSFVGTPAAIHFHVTTVILWLSLALAQPLLVRGGRVELHRRLGKLVYALVPIVLVGFVLAMVEGQRRHGNRDLMLATAFDASSFVFFVGMGIVHRGRPSYHKRFMVLSLLPFLNPTIGRIASPKVSLPVEVLILVSLIVHALVTRQEVRPYAIGLGFLAAAFGLVLIALV